MAYALALVDERPAHRHDAELGERLPIELHRMLALGLVLLEQALG